MHIMDLVENSFRAGSDRVEIEIREDRDSGYLTLIIRDNGKGVPEEELPKLLDPFYTTKEGKRIGLGIPLFYQACKRCGGDLSLEVNKASGLTLTGTMRLDSIDLPPYGDLGATISAILLGYPHLNLKFHWKIGHRAISLDTEELREGNLLDYPLIVGIGEEIRSFYNSTKGGKNA